MNSDTVVAIVASAGSLMTAAGGVWVVVKNAGRQTVTLDRAELRALRLAWIWAVRTITRLLAFIASLPGVELPEWAGKIQADMDEHDRHILGETEERKT